MSRDQGPQMHTRDGGEHIDTDYETELTAIDALIIGARFAACLMCAVSVVMVAFYWF